MSLCLDCQKVTIEALRDHDVPIKDNLAALIASAERGGCSFCSMCWTALQQGCQPAEIERHIRGEFLPHEQSTDWKIWISPLLQEFGIGAMKTGMGSHLLVSSGHFPRTVNEPGAGTSVYAHLSVFADPDTGAARHLVERYSTSSRNAELPVEWTRKMLTICQKSHVRCGPCVDRRMPTRVVDVGGRSGKKEPSVFVTDGCLGKYIALSYCWGDGVKHEIKLKKATYQAMVGRIDEQRMTQTHREALQLARQLGFRYVWIDALCIIQDSNEDWQTESLKMTEVYGNAELTLVAGRASDSTKGFVANPYRPVIEHRRLEYINPATPSAGPSEVFVGLPRSRETGPVSDRAWCFQESLLSRRSIVFGAEQLCFRCQERSVFEDGEVTANREGRYILNEFPSRMTDSVAHQETMLRQWYWLVDQYSFRSIFDPHDIFAALMGLARAVQKQLGCRYLAGLWEADLVRGLLWLGRNDVVFGAPRGKGKLALTRPVERNTKKPAHVLGRPATRAPSWSWASVEGPVLTLSYERPEKYRRKYRTPANRCIRPAAFGERDLGNPRWTTSDDDDIVGSGVDRVWMPHCELDMYAAPRRVRCSARKVPEYSAKTKWWFSAGKIAKRGVLLVADDAETAASPAPDEERVVAVGLFDVHDEQTPSLWCMRIIKEEGLMLRLDDQGKFHRLGVFVVENDAWFEDAVERRVSLV